MSERISNSRLDEYRANKAAKEAAVAADEQAKFEESLYGDSLKGGTDETFAPEHEARVKEASEYEEHLARMADPDYVSTTAGGFSDSVVRANSDGSYERVQPRIDISGAPTDAYEQEQVRIAAEEQKRAGDEALRDKFTSDPDLVIMNRISKMIDHLSNKNADLEKVSDDEVIEQNAKIAQLEDQLQKHLEEYEKRDDYDPAIADMLIDRGDKEARARAGANALQAKQEVVYDDPELQAAADIKKYIDENPEEAEANGVTKALDDLVREIDAAPTPGDGASRPRVSLEHPRRPSAEEGETTSERPQIADIVNGMIEAGLEGDYPAYSKFAETIRKRLDEKAKEKFEKPEDREAWSNERMEHIMDYYVQQVTARGASHSRSGDDLPAYDYADLSSSGEAPSRLPATESETAPAETFTDDEEDYINELMKADEQCDIRRFDELTGAMRQRLEEVAAGDSSLDSDEQRTAWVNDRLRKLRDEATRRRSHAASASGVDTDGDVLVAGRASAPGDGTGERDTDRGHEDDEEEDDEVRLSLKNRAIARMGTIFSKGKERFKNMNRREQTVVAIGAVALAVTSLWLISKGIHTGGTGNGTGGGAGAGGDWGPQPDPHALNGAPKPEHFTDAALHVSNGEGWFNTMAEAGITDPEKQQAILANGDVMSKLQDMGLAYKAPELGGWGISMPANGKMPTEALELLTNAAK